MNGKLYFKLLYEDFYKQAQTPRILFAMVYADEHKHKEIVCNYVHLLLRIVILIRT